MIKVFLVEDEYAIREGIRRTVNWEKEGFVLCGEAGDGEMAYPLILKEKPEILITDIRMPFMDGLELCRLVKEALPSVRILILSGYDDFSYAQEAIRIGVEEYLLKPLSEEMLLTKLRAVAEKIREEQASERAIEQYQIEREEIRYLERQQFFRDIVDGKVTVQQSLSKGKELGVEITSAWYGVVLVQIREKEEHYAPGGRSAREEEMLAFLRELRERLPFLLLYEHTDGAGCLIVKADSEEEILARQETVIGELQAEAQNHRDVINFIATGCPVDRLRDIRQSYREAVKMFAERYVYDESRVFRYGEKKAPAAVFGENGRSGINFRNGPGTEYPLLQNSMIPNGTVLPVTTEYRNSQGKFWGQVTYNGRVGVVTMQQVDPIEENQGSASTIQSGAVADRLSINRTAHTATAGDASSASQMNTSLFLLFGLFGIVVLSGAGAAGFALYRRRKE